MEFKFLVGSLFSFFFFFSCKDTSSGERLSMSKQTNEIVRPQTARTAAIYCWCFYAHPVVKRADGISEVVMRDCNTLLNVNPWEIMQPENRKYMISDSLDVNKLESMLNNNFIEEVAPSRSDDCRFILHISGGNEPEKTLIYIDPFKFRTGNVYRKYSFNVMDTLFKLFKTNTFDCPS